MAEGMTADVAEPRFDEDTAVQALGDGVFRASCSLAWSAPIGPNGGYLAAIVLRAMRAELGDDDRPARSLTLHYLRPPADGEVRVEVAVERSGRTLSTLTARLVQDGRLCIIAVGAFGAAFEAAADYATPPPEAPPWESITPIEHNPARPPISHRLVVRPALGYAPFSGAPEAVTGGWVTLREPAPVDEMLLALLVDAWLPASWCVLDRLAAAPTIDLTIHFRNPPAAAAHPVDVPLLCRFSSRTAADGYFEEDGGVWTPEGTLLAQSRQLALLRPWDGP